MEKKPENPQAFPSTRKYNEREMKWYEGEGMTLLDYFAGQALNGLNACMTDTDFPTVQTAENMAINAYRQAEAMLKERTKHQ